MEKIAVNRLWILALVVVIGIVLVSPTTPVKAATVYEDFDSYEIITLADDLTTPGATFISAEWVIFPAFLFESFSGNCLIQFDDTSALIIDFDTPKGSYWMRFATLEAGDSFRIWGYYQGVLQFTDSFIGSVPDDFPFAEGVAAGGGNQFDRLVVDGRLSMVMIDDLMAFDYVEPIDYPNHGEVLISVGAPVVPYAAPGEYAQPFSLPADYDGNGFDTYIITGTATVGGAVWYSIWVGGEDYLWVPASQVQVLR